MEHLDDRTPYDPLTGRTMEEDREVMAIVNSEQRRLAKKYHLDHELPPGYTSPSWVRDRLKGAAGD